MRWPHRTSQLRAILARELEDRFRESGWVVDGDAGDAPGSRRFGAFRRSIGREFIVTAVVDRVLMRPAGRGRVALVLTFSELALTLELGVEYLPLRRLGGAIGAPAPFGAVTVDVPTAVDADMLAGLRLSDLAAVRVATEVEARRTAAELARLATACAPAVAVSLASVDALLARQRAEPERSRAPVELVIAAMLAAAARYDAARAELEAFKPERLESASRRSDARRLRWRLAQWIDGHEGRESPARTPASPARERPQTFRETWHEARRISRAQRDAYRSVRRGARGKGRDERRRELEAELAARTPQREPLWVERSLDRLAASPAQRLRARVRGGRELRGLLRGMRRGMRGDAAAFEPPVWLDPPERAVYPGPPGLGADKALVLLDPGADADLRRVFAALPAAGATVRVRPWLSWDPEPRDASSVLAAHIGPYRVGTLAAVAAAALSPLMRAAAARGELPCVDGTLYRRDADGGFMLEIPLAKAPRAPR